MTLKKKATLVMISFCNFWAFGCGSMMPTVKNPYNLSGPKVDEQAGVLKPSSLPQLDQQGLDRGLLPLYALENDGDESLGWRIGPWPVKTGEIPPYLSRQGERHLGEQFRAGQTLATTAGVMSVMSCLAVIAGMGSVLLSTQYQTQVTGAYLIAGGLATFPLEDIFYWVAEANSYTAAKTFNEDLTKRFGPSPAPAP